MGNHDSAARKHMCMYELFEGCANFSKHGNFKSLSQPGTQDKSSSLNPGQALDAFLALKTLDDNFLECSRSPSQQEETTAQPRSQSHP